MKHSYKERHVRIGQVLVAREGETLKSLLGSCVGVALIWKNKKMCGLAHCLLPESPQKSYEINGRFVSQAIPSLLALMHIKPENFSEIEAVIAGGGNMTQPEERTNSKLIGAQNALRAQKFLRDLGIKIIFEDIGGEEGRRMSVNSTTGEFEVQKIPRQIAAS